MTQFDNLNRLQSRKAASEWLPDANEVLPRSAMPSESQRGSDSFHTHDWRFFRLYHTVWRLCHTCHKVQAKGKRPGWSRVRNAKCLHRAIASKLAKPIHYQQHNPKTTVNSLLPAQYHIPTFNTELRYH